VLIPLLWKTTGPGPAAAVATARADSDLIALIVTVVIAAHGRSFCQRRVDSLAGSVVFSNITAWRGGKPADYHGRMSNSVPSTVLAIGLPAGGKLIASASSRAQSPECSAAANLQMQIAPWIASISCQFLILRLLKPLIDIVRGLPSPPAEALQEFSKAAAELQPCLFAQTAAGVLPFIRDLLCLEIQSLNCLQRNLQSMATLAASEPSAVAASDVKTVVDSYQPMVGLLKLASGLFEIAGLDSPQEPALAPGTDAKSLAADQDTLASFIVTLQTAADSLGGCQ
jgi:hypothetical protein